MGRGARGGRDGADREAPRRWLAPRLVGAGVALPESSPRQFGAAASTVHDRLASTAWPGRTSPMHPRFRLIALALLLLAAFAPPADARYSRKKAIWGPTQVNGVSQFPIYRDLGVGHLPDAAVHGTKSRRPGRRIRGDPADPAYRLAQARSILRSGRGVASRHPRVADGSAARRPGRTAGARAEWAPANARDFATFARAAARRYPGVHLWQIWGEPSRQNNFKPLPRFEATGPRRYARILDAAYASLKRESRRNLVIGGNTFTTGDVSPRQFIRSMRLAERPPPADGPVRPQPIHAPKARTSARPAGSRLRGFLRPRHTRRVGRSEPGAPSRAADPPLPLGVHVPHRSPELRVQLLGHAAYPGRDGLSRALRITHRWRRIYALGWFALYDERPERSRRQVGRRGESRSVGMGRRQEALVPSIQARLTCLFLN